MSNTYLVFIIKGYDREEGDTIYGVVEIQVIATDYKEAMIKAKKIFKKPNYKLFTVIEKMYEHTN